MKKLFYLPSLLLLLGLSTNAQVGIGTTTPIASAALDITSTTNGFLPPRMTSAQRNAIATPVQGLMLYCTNCGANGEAQIYNGAAWVNLAGGTATFGCGDNVTHGGLTYGTVIGANSKCWLDRNLGATQVATSSTDANSHGHLYQWGRGTDGHQIRTSGTTTTLSASDTPGNVNFIMNGISPYDWRSSQNNNLWQGVSGVNNPCPSGYRIPTETEWNNERLSWTGGNNAAGALASPLKLPMAGRRVTSNGTLEGVGTYGHYWSSTVSGTSSRKLTFVDMVDGRRADGKSVRCIKD